MHVSSRRKSGSGVVEESFTRLKRSSCTTVVWGRLTSNGCAGGIWQESPRTLEKGVSTVGFSLEKRKEKNEYEMQKYTRDSTAIILDLHSYTDGWT